MRLRTRYLLSLLALVAVMTIPALYGIGRVHEMRSIALDLRQQAARTATAAGRLSRHVAELDRHQRAWVVTAEPELGWRVRSTLDAITAQADSLARLGYGQLIGAELPLAALQTSADSLHALMEADSLDAATDHIAITAVPVLAAADTAIVRLSAAIDRDIDARAAEAERIAAAALTATTLAIVLALLVAGLMAWLAARLLTRPLERLNEAMGAVAAGSLKTTADPALDREDEVGDLFRSFQTMTWRLLQLDRMKADLVGMASHDLKTPISVITGYAELLEEEAGELRDDHRAVLASLHSQARALGARVDQLIEISRMESRGLRLGVEEINIRHFAAGLDTAFAPLAHRHGVDLAVAVGSDAPTFIVADPDCLRSEVVGNLLEHSIKFSPRGGVVRVEFSGRGNALHLEVRDQGPPVPAHLAERMFDRYFHGPPGAGRIGSGVALPIAKTGVEAHGGTIRVESDEAGTRFLVELPLRPVEAGRDAPGRTRRPATS
jgi:signal transduction histidine kinase